MILPFKNKFEGPIMRGTKIHTIREDKHDRWKPGRSIHFAKGVRTKKYVNFKVGKCVSTQKIEIIDNDILEDLIVKVDGRKLSVDEIQKLSWNDGFINIIEFWLFFSGGFSGKLIHWTDFKY